MTEKCQICENLHDVKDVKVRDYCHQYSGSTHHICNVNFELENKTSALIS